MPPMHAFVMWSESLPCRSGNLQRASDTFCSRPASSQWRL